MTIEEQLQMLVQVAGSHEDNLNRRFEMQAKNETMLAEVVGAISALRESVTGLARIASMHERRITDLEGGSA